MRAIDGEFPFEPEITLEPLLGMLGNHRHEQGAGLYLLADLLVPGIPAAQLALIEEDLDAGSAQASQILSAASASCEA